MRNMKNTFASTSRQAVNRLSPHQRLALNGFAVLLAIDTVYTSIGVLSGRFVELNPFINAVMCGKLISILFIAISHIVFFVIVLGAITWILYKHTREGDQNGYTRFVVSMMCYIPFTIMSFAMWFNICLNWFSGAMT